MEFIEFNPEIDLKNKKIIGVDEVGVGDFFGPLVSASVFIPFENLEKVIELGVKDSKKLSTNQIIKISKELRKMVIYSTYVLSPKGYNNLNKKYNANYLKTFCHINSITKLQDKNIKDIDYIFLDQYSTINTIKQYFKSFYEENNWASFSPIKFKVLLAFKAESLSIAVACASILARAEFLQYLEKMNQEYQVVFPLGSGEKTKMFVQEFFTNNTNVNKNEVCKLHFDMSLDKNK